MPKLLFSRFALTVALAGTIFLTACQTSAATAPTPPVVTTTPVAPTTPVVAATSVAAATPVAAATSVAADSATATRAAAPTLPPTHTPTVAPAETQAPTETPVPPTATPAPTLGFDSDQGLSGWCVPPEALLPDSADPASPPEGAKIGKIIGTAFQIDNLPANGCVFMYTFNQPAPEGLKLEVYDLIQKTPWLQADLKPVNGRPNSVAVILRHAYIIAPPQWKASYFFAVSDASGKELRRDQVNLNRWTPRLCWNGLPPNVNTLRCPMAEDLHPWDPSYRTPIPTYIPPEYWKAQ